jgi:hypothetical protein
VTARAMLRGVCTAALLATFASSALASVTINIINTDGPGEGFNDPTPAAPVGGNTGTTVGQQRLNCFTHAASIWGSILTSPVPINIQAAFNPLTCTATSAVLGSAGPLTVNQNNPAFEFQGYWYHAALANKEAGTDQDPSGADINAQFNSNLGQTNCLTGSGWYYGFDHNEGALIDLVDVLLHEFGHGLGFSTLTSGSTGSYFTSAPSVWDKFLYDEGTSLHWDQMTATQRAASAINTNNLTWDGSVVKATAPTFLANAPELVVPFGSGSLTGNTASFGGAITLGGVTAQALLVNDGVASTSTSDACESPFVNAAAMAGKIAVVDRGTCTFVVKVKNAQLNGAVACIIVNNTTGTLSPSGTDASITIPVFAITQADGASLKSAIAAGATTVTLRLSPTKRAGLSTGGRVLMYAPNPFQSGSSVSHWDVSATPNLLMEPAINSDLTDSVDLTTDLFRDIGWLPRTAGVPAPSTPGPSVLASRPNPARGGTSIHFELASDETVELALYDVAGRQVRSLVKGTFLAGPHDVTWDGMDVAGRPVSAGVYLARLHGPHTQATQHVVLVN